MKAAFNLIEGYLNGLALDILLTKSVSEEERSKLSEWDEERKRSVSLSLRDKILQYPKIATGRDHPPIQESSTPAMKLVLDLKRKVRHALIHPTPWVSFKNPSEFREQIFFQLEIENVATICDAVLDLISVIAETVGDAYGDVSLWLFRRDADGRFPKEAFREQAIYLAVAADAPYSATRQKQECTHWQRTSALSQRRRDGFDTLQSR